MSDNTPLFNLDFTSTTDSDTHAALVAEAKVSLLDLITVENDIPVPSVKAVSELAAIRDAASIILDEMPPVNDATHTEHVESVTGQLVDLLTKPSDYGFHTVSVMVMAEGADCHSVGLGYVVATDNHMRTVSTTGVGLFSAQRDILLSAFGDAAKSLSQREGIIGTRSSALSKAGVEVKELTLYDIGVPGETITPLETVSRKAPKKRK